MAKQTSTTKYKIQKHMKHIQKYENISKPIKYKQ